MRSSQGHFVKASGLRWISLMLLAPVPFAAKVWALPFLTALAPSERYAQAQGRSHKPLTDRARLLLLLLARWLPGRQVIVVADSSYAAIELLAAVRRHLTMITRSLVSDRGRSSSPIWSVWLHNWAPPWDSRGVSPTWPDSRPGLAGCGKSAS